MLLVQISYTSRAKFHVWNYDDDIRASSLSNFSNLSKLE